jgi:4-hydroxy-tetrahydrodipicolinate reductase
MSNVKTILAAKVHAVVGTTGLTSQNLEEIKLLCAENKVNCLVAPNFAIGAVLMMRFAKEAIKHMPQAEIIEFHHETKADKPSGTALKTAQLMGKEVPIHSVRLPGLVAHQEVIFGGLGQTLTLRHDSISRESFMPGVVMAIRKIAGVRGLVYGLENLL